MIVDSIIKANDRTIINHSSRKIFLETFSKLIKCNESIGKQLPFKLYPDVLKINREGNILFMGEAKDTESPSNSNTILRLIHYFYWIAYHINIRNGTGIFSVCFGRKSDLGGWSRLILNISKYYKLNVKETDYEEFGEDLILLWFLF